ncbi:ABC transporter permease [Bacteroides sp.]|uniref:ABC transporter permease n=1 Tax=Bacteroides sp. TaxID=29523 RepID=UPI00260E7874|nr:ABC transporter permease [Bacteroides sp.]MDD3037691.1 FtsX-like permease family protein [Bacteroides sp.]
MKTLKYAWRFLMRTKSYTVINIVGLALSLACTIILVRYIHQEKIVNSHCVDAANVFIPLRDIDGNVYAGNASINSGADTVYYSPESVKEQARFVTLNNDNVTINDRPYIVQLLATDTTFFHFFTYPLSGTMMQTPNDVLVTRKFAERAFGKDNPIGKKINYAGGHVLTVCGILDESACKSSLTFDLVLNFELKKNDAGWGRMCIDLLRFMPGVDVSAINTFSTIYRQTDKYRIRYDFIPVSELYWNKVLAAKGENPEMWHYGSRSHLWILSGVCLLLMLAGILNFINIYLVFMLKRSKEYGIRKVFGIRGRTLFFQLWTENVLMVVAALFLAWFFIEMFSGYANRLLESNVSYTDFDWQLSLAIFLLLPLLTTAYPYFKYNYLPPIVSIRTIGTSRQSVATRTFFLFVQYSITLLLIILSLYFSSHLRFLLNTSPGFRTEGILYVNMMSKILYFDNSTYQEREDSKNKCDAMVQKLNECPYIERWFAGDVNRDGIFSTGGISTLINDKGTSLNITMMWVPSDFFRVYGLTVIDGTLPNNDQEVDYQVAMNETALKAFGYSRREDAFVRGETALWWYASENGGTAEGGLSLMPVQAIVKDYYSGHLTAGKKPIVYMISNEGVNPFCQIASKPGKEKELINYLKKSREDIYRTQELDYRWLKDDIARLYKEDRRIAIVFSLFATISIFVSVLGLFGLSLFDIRQRYREIAIRKVNGARLSNLYLILLRKYIWIMAGAIILTVPLSYFLIHTYTSDFVVKAPISIFIYVIALLIVIAISLGTLLWQVNKAARINPAEIIKTE